MSNFFNEIVQKIFLALGTLSLLAVATGMTPDPIKKELISHALASTQATSVMDHKCGPGESTRTLSNLAKPYDKQTLCTYGGKYGHGE